MTHELVITQHVPAPVEEVWAAWTSAEGWARWWWPQWADTEYVVDARPGGTYLARSVEGDARVTGEFTTVEAPHLLEMTWRWGEPVELIWSDDGIVLRLPEAHDELPLDELLVDPDDVDRILVEHLPSSALFASRFRECAARALLLPRRRPDRRTPLWQQRQRAAPVRHRPEKQAERPELDGQSLEERQIDEGAPEVGISDHARIAGHENEAGGQEDDPGQRGKADAGIERAPAAQPQPAQAIPAQADEHAGGADAAENERRAGAPAGIAGLTTTEENGNRCSEDDRAH